MILRTLRYDQVKTLGMLLVGIHIEKLYVDDKR